MNLTSALARTSRLGIVTALGTALGILALCLVFQFVVPAPVGSETSYTGQKNFNYRSLILYATAGGMHLLLCIGAVVFFEEQLRRNESRVEFSNVLVYAAIALCVIFSIVLFACWVDLNVVGQSYDERIRPMQGDPRLSFLFAARLLAGLKFHLFALFPLALVFLGVAAAVMACFWISHKVIAFADRADDLKNADVLELKRNLAQLIGFIAIVFTTSTVATIALMQVGRDWVEKGSLRDAYIQNGHAMSIFWSACYTSVIALIVVLPLWWMASRTRRIQRQARHAGGRSTFYDQIFESLSYQSIAKAGVATLAPLLTSSAAALFGS